MGAFRPCQGTEFMRHADLRMGVILLVTRTCPSRASPCSPSDEPDCGFLDAT